MIPADAPCRSSKTFCQPLCALRAFWDAKRGTRPMPERRDVLAEEFRPWFGHMVICKVEGDAARLRVTLAGTEVVRYYSRDLTGQYLDIALAAAGLHWVVDSYRECARTQAPQLVFSPPITVQGTARALLRLLLPCGRDGRVDTILSGIYPVNGAVPSCSVLPETHR